MANDPDIEEEEYGKHFGRLDLDRVGFFDDAPPGPWDGYRNKPSGGGLRESNATGKQMSCKRVGGLFDRQFKRLFIGEADKDDIPPLPPSKQGEKDEEKDVNKPIIMTPGYPKKHSTPGDWYGCIGKQFKHFSPETKPEPPVEPKPLNFKTSPAPFGGPGYANYCINKYVKMYKDYEPYDIEKIMPKDSEQEGLRPKVFVTTFVPRPYFNENPYALVHMPPSHKKPPLPRVKKQTRIQFHLTFPRAPFGRNSGCFYPFPKYFSDPYDKIPKKKGKKVKPKAPLHLVGVAECKSKFTVSIVERVTRVSCNAVTYIDYREQVYPIK
ncbi:UPF0602 protein C4orf47 homolog [Phymastichus coffea]|uniref:UPF0602 protein C4orf47 homolog n=1 Tax=Phymastichus coffea TaxID=108790 RepID=UPI00273C99C4|nr:UPF0602 protein C4orf47 homolog [Phymastichus coffea]